MRLAKREVSRFENTVGEVDCIKWRDVTFSWTGNHNNVDEYTATGYFLGIHPKYVYEKLVIFADFKHEVFHLKTGRGKEVTWVNLLGI